MRQPSRVGVGEVLLDVALRVDHGGNPAGFLGDEVGGVREAAEIVLLENHDWLAELMSVSGNGDPSPALHRASARNRTLISRPPSAPGFTSSAAWCARAIAA